MTRPMPLAFSESEYARRLRDLRARMHAKSLDALLVVVAENITYLSGYETIGYSNFGVLVVRQDAGRADKPGLVGIGFARDHDGAGAMPP